MKWIELWAKIEVISFIFGIIILIIGTIILFLKDRKWLNDRWKITRKVVKCIW